MLIKSTAAYAINRFGNSSLLGHTKQHYLLAGAVFFIKQSTSVKVMTEVSFVVSILEQKRKFAKKGCFFEEAHAEVAAIGVAQKNLSYS